MTMGAAQWYRSESALLEELRRASPRPAGPPEVPGYSDLVEIRRGGQGAVYSAVQRSTRRTVAVKVMLDAAPTVGARRRFEREVDLAASLRHPGVVRVYDGGTTADGRPYLVMEHIDGRPLDEFIEARGWQGRAGARPIVELFKRATEAVQYAHERGVIHRDLKPSNILITADGQPHVVDFGLAKALRAGDSAEITISATGQFMGSLAWASPEQASGSAAGADVRSDVYALGVMLYRALTGRYPYDVTGPIRAVLNRIGAQPPERPSRAAPWIDADLETILLTCLAKEPARRYAGAGALADDLRRWLGGEPILARADSAWYLVRSAVRRHRGPVLTGAAVFVLSVVASVVLGIMYARAARAEREAVRQGLEKGAANQFLQEVLGAANPSASGRQVRVVDVLSRARERLRTDEGIADETRSALHETLGVTYAGLSMHAEAAAMLEAAAAERQRRLGPEHADTLGARVHLAMARLRLGNLDEAESMAGAVLEIAERTCAPGHPVRAGALHVLGLVRYNRGRLADAEAMLARAVAEAESGPSADRRLEIVGDLAMVYRAQSRLPESERLYREQLNRAVERRGERGPEALRLMNNLAVLLNRRGGSEEAERLYRQCEAASIEVLGEDSDNTISTRINLAKMLADQRRFEEAEPRSRAAYEQCVRVLGPEHPTTLSAMNNLSSLLADAGKLDEAEALLRGCLEIRLRTLGEEHPRTLVTMSNLSSLLRDRGRDGEALENDGRVLEIRRRTLGEDHLDTLNTLNNIGLALFKLGRFEEAAERFARAAAGVDRAAPKHWTAGQYRANLGRALLKVGRPTEAESHLRAAHALMTATLGERDARTRQTVASLAEALRALGRADEAEALAPAGAGDKQP
ncbi:MAG: serine/threonine protein kinase [Phycisphaeraceae bacterium]|nr:serine/threonine protein kinase [Phycisphaeraceae bacterium]